MNKPILLLLLSAVLAFISCDKKQSTQVVYVTDSTANNTSDSFDNSYYIPGLADMIITSFEEKTIEIRIEQHTIMDKRVSLSVEGFPSNSSGWFTVEKGYPPFNTTLHIKSGYIAEGVYPIKITTVAEGNKPKEYTFDLRATPMGHTSCVDFFMSRFKQNAKKITANSPDPVPDGNLNLKKSIDANYELYLGDLLLYHDANWMNAYKSSGNYYNTSLISPQHVNLKFNCSTFEITIPEQSVLGRQNNSSVNDTFMVKGNGQVDISRGTYSIKFYSSFDDAGTPKSIEYTIEGDFVQ